jgi:hypothetical protein
MLCLYAIIQSNCFPMFIVTVFVFFYCCLSRLELLICCVNLFIRTVDGQIKLGQK